MPSFLPSVKTNFHASGSQLNERRKILAQAHHHDSARLSVLKAEKPPAVLAINRLRNWVLANQSTCLKDVNSKLIFESSPVNDLIFNRIFSEVPNMGGDLPHLPKGEWFMAPKLSSVLGFVVRYLGNITPSSRFNGVAQEPDFIEWSCTPYQVAKMLIDTVGNDVLQHPPRYYCAPDGGSFWRLWVAMDQDQGKLWISSPSWGKEGAFLLQYPTEFCDPAELQANDSFVGGVRVSWDHHLYQMRHECPNPRVLTWPNIDHQPNAHSGDARQFSNQHYVEFFTHPRWQFLHVLPEGRNFKVSSAVELNILPGLSQKSTVMGLDQGSGGRYCCGSTLFSSPEAWLGLFGMFQTLPRKMVAVDEFAHGLVEQTKKNSFVPALSDILGRADKYCGDASSADITFVPGVQAIIHRLSQLLNRMPSEVQLKRFVPSQLNPDRGPGSFRSGLQAWFSQKNGIRYLNMSLTGMSAEVGQLYFQQQILSSEPYIGGGMRVMIGPKATDKNRGVPEYFMSPEMAQPVFQLSLDKMMDIRDFPVTKMMNEKQDTAFYRSMIEFSQEMPIS